MSERLSTDVVRHVASLARLDITEEEVEHFSEQLSAIAGLFNDMELLDLTDVPPTTHALPITNVFRKDEVRPSLDRDVVLAEAPAAEGNRFRVPRILGGEQ